MEHILLVNIPMQQQLQITCPSREKAEDTIKDGLNGLIEIDQPHNRSRLVAHTVPGTIYCIIPKEELERAMGQARLMGATAPRAGH